MVSPLGVKGDLAAGHRVPPGWLTRRLRTLARLDIGGYRKEWQRARTAHWSKLDSNGYERLIQRIRVCLKGEPLWMVEQYWQGHQ